jgi:hypothetical protein
MTDIPAEAPLFRPYNLGSQARGVSTPGRACRAHSSQETAFVVWASMDQKSSDMARLTKAQANDGWAASRRFGTRNL